MAKRNWRARQKRMQSAVRHSIELNKSLHYVNDRISREKAVQAAGGDGEVVAEFHIDRGHPAGPEIHYLTNTGMIIICNEWTGRFITKLIARPGQISRYYPNCDAPRALMAAAREHQLEGLNRC